MIEKLTYITPFERPRMSGAYALIPLAIALLLLGWGFKDAYDYSTPTKIVAHLNKNCWVTENKRGGKEIGMAQQSARKDFKEVRMERYYLLPNDVVGVGACGVVTDCQADCPSLLPIGAEVWMVYHSTYYLLCKDRPIPPATICYLVAGLSALIVSLYVYLRSITQAK